MECLVEGILSNKLGNIGSVNGNKWSVLESPKMEGKIPRSKTPYLPSDVGQGHISLSLGMVSVHICLYKFNIGL